MKSWLIDKPDWREAHKDLPAVKPKNTNKVWFNSESEWNIARSKLTVTDETGWSSRGANGELVALWFENEGWIKI